MLQFASFPVCRTGPSSNEAPLTWLRDARQAADGLSVFSALRPRTLLRLASPFCSTPRVVALPVAQWLWRADGSPRGRKKPAAYLVIAGQECARPIRESRPVSAFSMCVPRPSETAPNSAKLCRHSSSPVGRLHAYPWEGRSPGSPASGSRAITVVSSFAFSRKVTLLMNSVLCREEAT